MKPTNNKLILDACCGSRMFWFDKENPLALFADIREEWVYEPVLTGQEFSDQRGMYVDTLQFGEGGSVIHYYRRRVGV